MRFPNHLTALAILLGACAPSVSGSDNGDGGGPVITDDGGILRAPDGGPLVTDDQRCTKMDVLFVIDNSGSMSEEQASLADNFPMFASLLDNYKDANGNSIDYRVAITTTGRDIDYTIVIPPTFGLPEEDFPTTEKGENGDFQQRCGMTRRWMERDDPGVESTLSCVAQVGTDGPSIEMPLYMSIMSLRDRVADGTNAGFLRDDALLAIIYITDEDDCSRTDNNFRIMTDKDGCSGNPWNIMPNDVLTFLDNLKGGRGRWATAVIAGPTDCSSAFGDAEQANKLLDFVAQTNSGSTHNAVFASICDGSLTPALQSALSTFTAACEAFPPIGKPITH